MYCMIAQLSQSDPFGRPDSSSSGVRSAGSLDRNSVVPLLPHMSTSSKSSPAARMKIRADRLLTLGFRMLSVCVAIGPLLCALRVWRGESLLGVGVLRCAVLGQRWA